ncbi:MAG: metallophosphoesterase family protein, partial [Gemmatimonadaceae bacterium]
MTARKQRGQSIAKAVRKTSGSRATKSPNREKATFKSRAPLTVRAIEAPRVGRIVHISDLHLEPDSLPGSASAKVRPATGVAAFDTALLDRFVSGLEVSSAELLIVSGDLVNGPSLARAADGSPLDAAGVAAQRGRGMQFAADFIRKLASRLGITDLARHVIVVPGNHDVDLEAAKVGADPLTAFKAATKDFLTPFSNPPFALDENLGVAVLALDNTFLLGKDLAGKDGKPIHAGAPAFDRTAITRIAKKISEEKTALATKSDRQFDPLGIVVAHYPPGVVPTGEIDLELVEISFGAAQAKSALVEAGFGLFLHGHKHTAYVQEESGRSPGDDERGNSAVVLGAASLTQPPRGSSAGINRLEYAANTKCGGGNVLVHAYNLVDFKPIKATVEPWRVSVPTPAVGVARLVRLNERIDVFGDSRTDVTFYDIPVPSDRRGAGLWETKAGKWVRTFERLVQVPGMLTGAPLVKALPQNHDVEANALRVSDTTDDGGRSWHVQVRAAPDAGSVSFTERTWSLNGYALSVDQQREVFAAPRGNDDFYGWENLAHCVREPVEELEFFIRYPYEMNPAACEVRVETSVEESGALASVSPRDVYRDDLLQFSRVRVEQMQFMRRLRVVIARPILGVTYWVLWKLPR